MLSLSRIKPGRLLQVVAGGIAAVLLFSLVTACSRADEQSTSGGLTKIRASVPYSGLEVFAPLYLAKHFGIFESHGLDVEISVVPTADMVAVIQRGTIDVAAAGVSAGVLNAIHSGADLRYIAGGPSYPAESKQGYWLRKELIPPGGIEQFDPCELRGKLVSPGGAGIAGAAVAPLYHYLKKCNLTIKDIRISPLAGADLAAALEAGAVDLGQLSDPIWTDADRKGYAELLIPFGTAQQTGYLMGEFRHKNPEATRAFAKSIAEANAKYLQGDYHANPEVLAALVEELKVPEETLKANLPLIFPPDAVFEADEILRSIQEAWIGIGGLLNYDTPLPTDRIIDNSFVKS